MRLVSSTSRTFLCITPLRSPFSGPTAVHSSHSLSQLLRLFFLSLPFQRRHVSTPQMSSLQSQRTFFSLPPWQPCTQPSFTHPALSYRTKKVSFCSCTCPRIQEQPCRFSSPAKHQYLSSQCSDVLPFCFFRLLFTPSFSSSTGDSAPLLQCALRALPVTASVRQPLQHSRPRTHFLPSSKQKELVSWRLWAASRLPSISPQSL